MARGIATTLTAATLLAGLAGATGDAAAARDAGQGRTHDTATCAMPVDCTLREAGDVVGIRFGLHAEHADDFPTIAAQAHLTVAHAFSWAVMETSRDTWDFSVADASVAFAAENGLDVIAMHFAWDQEALDDLPDWVASITDPDELRAELVERAEAIFGRYPDLDRITVVNEPIETLGDEVAQNHFAQVLGDDWVTQIFQIVMAEAPPGTELVLNENLVEYVPAKADALVALVEDLLTAGVRLDRVGLQTHLFFGEPDWALLSSTMGRIEDLGVGTYVSELDVPVAPELPDRLDVQADRYRRAVETCLAHAGCDAVVVWGVSDAHTWYDWFLGPGQDPVLWDDAMARKPAWFAVRDALLLGRPAFGDVPARHRFFAPIQWLAAHDLAGGYADGGFHPTAAVSRQALAALVSRTVGGGALSPPPPPRFADVPFSHTFWAEIEAVAQAGLLAGYADGGFHPSAPVSRQALAAALHRLAGSPAPPTVTEPTFADVPLDHPFAAEIEWLASTGVASGYADGGFHPAAPVSRQAVAALLAAYDELVAPLS